MKWVVVTVTVIVALVIVGALGVAYHLKTNFPKADPPYNIRVSGTPEQIARGRYLANHVTVCLECHSTRDWAHYSAPPLPGTEGKGGEVFPETAGFPGTLIAPNITPAALGDWTDGEIIRAFTSGVNKNGDPLFPLMPYRAYRNLMPADIESIVAYVRTLSPIDHIPPRSTLNFPINLLVRTMPEPYKLPKPFDRSDPVAYGEYLATIAGCATCHTPHDQKLREPVEDMQFAGGFQFRLPSGKTVQSANITPDIETGIGHWKKEYFIGRFRQFAGEKAKHILLQDGMNSVMPWTMYAGITDEDLSAIYDYLQTVAPIRNAVERFVE